MRSAQLYIREFGSGFPVVLLHGMPSSRAYLSPLITALDATLRVVVPDLPGYSRSPALPRGWTWEDAQEQLEEALLGRGIAACIVIGSSLGGWRGLALALGRRVDVRGMILLGGFANLTREQRDSFIGLAGMAPGETDLGDLYAGVALSPGFRHAHPESDLLVREFFADISPADLADEFKAVAGIPDLTGHLSTLSMPILARAGALDAAVPYTASEVIASSVKHGRLELVPGVGHSLLIEDVEGTLASVKRLIESLG